MQINSSIRVCFGDPDHDQAPRTKPSHALKQLGPHDLVTPVPGFHRSIMDRGKKVQILHSYFYENTCMCMLSARHKVQY